MLKDRAPEVLKLWKPWPWLTQDEIAARTGLKTTQVAHIVSVYLLRKGRRRDDPPAGSVQKPFVQLSRGIERTKGRHGVTLARVPSLEASHA
jgi:hypothetical protein